MSYISEAGGSQLTSTEIAVVASLTAMSVSGAGQAIAKTGATSFGNVSATGTATRQTLTDTGDHQNFTAPGTITSVYALMTKNGQYLSIDNYSYSGTVVTLVVPDANIASVGLELIYS